MAAGQRSDGRPDGAIPTPPFALPYVRERELRLRQLGLVVMPVAHKTGYPVLVVEERVPTLEAAVMGVLKWELPHLWPAEKRSESPGKPTSDLGDMNAAVGRGPAATEIVAKDAPSMKKEVAMVSSSHTENSKRLVATVATSFVGGQGRDM